MTALVLLPRSSPSTEKQAHSVSSKPARSSVLSDSASSGRIGKRHVADTDRTSSSESARLAWGTAVSDSDGDKWDRSNLPNHGRGDYVVQTQTPRLLASYPLAFDDGEHVPQTEQPGVP
jgi:hypothetical protein